MLGKWHSTELKSAVFLTATWMCFRVERKTVIAKFYTGKELERLKRIYDRAQSAQLTTLALYFAHKKVVDDISTLSKVQILLPDASKRV